MADLIDADEVLAQALIEWAARHPRPDLPLISTAEGQTFTPRQLAIEVPERTAFGRLQLRALRLLADAEPELGVSGVAQHFRQLARQRGIDNDRGFEPPLSGPVAH